MVVSFFSVSRALWCDRPFAGGADDISRYSKKIKEKLRVLRERFIFA